MPPCADDAREAEVGDLRDAVAPQQHVRGLDVAVDDLAPVQERDGRGDVRRHGPKRDAEARERVPRAEAREELVGRALVEQAVQRPVGRELEHGPEQALVVVGDGAEQRDDVRVAQRPERLELAPHGDGGVVVVDGDHLHGDGPPAPGGALDDAVRAAAQRPSPGDDDVLADDGRRRLHGRAPAAQVRGESAVDAGGRPERRAAGRAVVPRPPPARERVLVEDLTTRTQDGLRRHLACDAARRRRLRRRQIVEHGRERRHQRCVRFGVRAADVEPRPVLASRAQARPARPGHIDSGNPKTAC